MKKHELTALENEIDDSLWTKKDVAKFARITPRTVENWMANGALPYFRIGRTIRFRLPDILQHLAQNHRVGPE